MDHALIMAGQLIAPVIERDAATGFDWVVDCLRSSNCNDLANDMEIAKALNCIHYPSPSPTPPLSSLSPVLPTSKLLVRLIVKRYETQRL